jgi:hypothetical protein
LSHGVVAGIAFWFLFPKHQIAQISVLFWAIMFSIVLWFLFFVLGRRIFESA